MFQMIPKKKVQKWKKEAILNLSANAHQHQYKKVAKVFTDPKLIGLKKIRKIHLFLQLNARNIINHSLCIVNQQKNLFVQFVSAIKQNWMEILFLLGWLKIILKKKQELIGNKPKWYLETFKMPIKLWTKTVLFLKTVIKMEWKQFKQFLFKWKTMWNLFKERQNKNLWHFSRINLNSVNKLYKILLI